MQITELHRLSREAFIDQIGHVFEHSPWVADSAYEKAGPFHSSEEVYKQLLDAMHEGTDDQKLSLLRAHPDLGSRIQMTDASVSEQKGAGLNQLSEQEYEMLKRLNTHYTDRFGFPFILAVKGKTKDDIITNIESRIENSRDEEFETALNEVGKIAVFRLHDLFGGEFEKEELNHV